MWQARWFGPFYPGALRRVDARRAVPSASSCGRRGADPSRFAKVVESCAYYLNPFEWWAYSRDDHWPPSGKVRGLGWRNPIVRPRRH